MSGISYSSPEKLFADLPGPYLYAVQIPGETVWWSQKDLSERAGCPLPRVAVASQHWAWLKNKYPGIVRVKRPGKQPLK
jgi:hypothetical protein